MKRNFAAPLLALSMFFISLSGNFVIAQTVIGGSTPDPSALLDVQSINKGVLLPRMTTTERNAISNPATGLMIFNTTTECLEINLGTAASPTWASIKCKVLSITALDAENSRLVGNPILPNAAVSTFSALVPYTGGNGDAHSGQTVSSVGVTGLTATLASGSFVVGNDSLTYDLSGTATSSGLAIFLLDIGGQKDTLKVPVGCGAYVAADTWKVFGCYNLGAANTSGDPFTPSWEINGAYWQWGRSIPPAQGPTGPNLADSNKDAITGWDSSKAADGSWTDDLSGTLPNNPCPSGFRVPTNEQWEGVANSNSFTAIGTTWGTFNDPVNYSTGLKLGNNLFLPAAGQRDAITGALSVRGATGYYWSSSQDQNNAYLFLVFDFGPQTTGGGLRSNAFSVRCIEE